MLLGIALLGVAHAGYGDPTGGVPSLAEREVVLWTNAARVAPDAFATEYAAAGCSTADFTADDLVPKAPLSWNDGLGAAARFHSDDMANNDWFDHSSSDGTSFADRLAKFYPSGTIGENIAWGYADSREAVLSGWMCSTHGHREAIMSSGWDELGAGVNGAYYTEDFGLRGVPTRALSMGIHSPGVPSGKATFYVDFYDEAGAAPKKIRVFVDGHPADMTLKWGTDGQGIYQALVGAGSTCHEYWFEAVGSDGVEARFPESGSYGWGDCAWDDADAQWLAEQLDESLPTDTGDTGTAGDDTDGGGDSDTDAGDTDAGDTDGQDTDGTTATARDKHGCDTGAAGGGALLASAGLLSLVTRRRSG